MYVQGRTRPRRHGQEGQDGVEDLPRPVPVDISAAGSGTCICICIFSTCVPKGAGKILGGACACACAHGTGSTSISRSGTSAGDGAGIDDGGVGEEAEEAERPARRPGPAEELDPLRRAAAGIGIGIGPSLRGEAGGQIAEHPGRVEGQGGQVAGRAAAGVISTSSRAARAAAAKAQAPDQVGACRGHDGAPPPPPPAAAVCPCVHTAACINNNVLPLPIQQLQMDQDVVLKEQPRPLRRRERQTPLQPRGTEGGQQRRPGGLGGRRVRRICSYSYFFGGGGGGSATAIRTRTCIFLLQRHGERRGRGRQLVRRGRVAPHWLLANGYLLLLLLLSSYMYT